MRKFNYFLQYLIIKILFVIFKILGYKKSSNLGEYIGRNIGPIFKSKKITKKNINYLPSSFDDHKKQLIIKKMWGNYGRILSEYVFIKNFRNNSLEKNIKINGSEYLEKIKANNKPVVFISGHFNNFELMAMQIEKSGIKLGTVYRPLNNFFLNRTMEEIRINYICKNQIKKGLSGIREILTFFKTNTSIALMIDQRVTEGIKSNLFNNLAYTTTIPAQLVKKFNCPIVPVYIERIDNINFEITINKPIIFDQKKDIPSITQELNYWLEKMILKNPEQWIWTHNRWKL